MVPLRPPESIKIGPYTYTIRFVDGLKSDDDDVSCGTAAALYGRVIWADQTILLEAKLSPDMMKETLNHEILHVIWDVTGGHSEDHPLDEEYVIRKVSPMWIDTYKRNKKLRKYVFGEE